MKGISLFLFTSILSFLASAALAQDLPAGDNGSTSLQKKREKTFLIAVNHADMLDTYLSQEGFTGTELRYINQTLKSKGRHRTSTEVTHQTLISATGTRGSKRSMLTAVYHFDAGLFRNFYFPRQRICLQAGGLVNGVLGGSYNTRNMNNIAQARVSLAIDPAAKASWGFRIGKLPCALRYELSTPLIGLAFSPAYGQSYYEIFSQGNYDHNIVLTSPFNAFQLHQRLTFQFRVWRATLCLGMISDIRQLKANHLKYHSYSHGLSLGWKM